MPAAEQTIITLSRPRLDGCDFEFSIGRQLLGVCASVCVNGGEIEKGFYIYTGAGNQNCIEGNRPMNILKQQVTWQHKPCRRTCI